MTALTDLGEIVQAGGRTRRAARLAQIITAEFALIGSAHLASALAGKMSDADWADAATVAGDPVPDAPTREMVFELLSLRREGIW